MSLQLHFFAKLLNFHLQLFLFWQIFDVQGRHLRPRTGPRGSCGSGAAGNGANQGASQNNCCACAPRPRAQDGTASPRWSPASRALSRLRTCPLGQPCPAAQDLKIPDLPRVPTTPGGPFQVSWGGFSPRTLKSAAGSPMRMLALCPAPDPATPTGDRPGLGPKSWELR